MPLKRFRRSLSFAGTMPVHSSTINCSTVDAIRLILFLEGARGTGMHRGDVRHIAWTRPRLAVAVVAFTYVRHYTEFILMSPPYALEREQPTF